MGYQQAKGLGHQGEGPGELGLLPTVLRVSPRVGLDCTIYCRFYSCKGEGGWVSVKILDPLDCCTHWNNKKNDQRGELPNFI
jgi:hypothetical protein